MSENVYHQAIDNERIPLCFDTNSIFGKKAGPAFLINIRERFPKRRLLIPTWVVAERSRQLKLKYGEKFKLSEIRDFLQDADIAIELVGFDDTVMRLEQNKLQSDWLKVVGQFEDNEWAWEKRLLPKENKDEPCAQRCRTGDHIVYAIALRHSALLVTEDKQLLDQVLKDGTYPGAIRAKELKRFIGYHIG
jgi:hypothetical protein